MTTEIIPIQKEQIAGELFPTEEVLMTADAIELRHSLLHKALILGNTYHHKVKIVFETVAQTKFVETTIWSVDEFMISLKGGVMIPIRRICDIVI